MNWRELLQRVLDTPPAQVLILVGLTITLAAILAFLDFWEDTNK